MTQLTWFTFWSNNHKNINTEKYWSSPLLYIFNRPHALLLSSRKLTFPTISFDSLQRWKNFFFFLYSATDWIVKLGSKNKLIEKVTNRLSKDFSTCRDKNDWGIWKVIENDVYCSLKNLLWTNPKSLKYQCK